MTLRVEHGELDRWVIDLDKAASAAPDEAARVVEKGAVNIKKGMRQRIGRPRHAPAYPNAISYDTGRDLRGPMAEIGPDKNKRQGALGNVLNYGTINNPPIPHVEPAADEEKPRFERAMEDLAERLLEGR